MANVGARPISFGLLSSNGACRNFFLMNTYSASRSMPSRNSFRIRMYDFGTFQFHVHKPCRMNTSPATRYVFFLLVATAHRTESASALTPSQSADPSGRLATPLPSADPRPSRKLRFCKPRRISTSLFHTSRCRSYLLPIQHFRDFARRSGVGDPGGQGTNREHAGQLSAVSNQSSAQSRTLTAGSS
jgi:hypothetical protein